MKLFNKIIKTETDKLIGRAVREAMTGRFEKAKTSIKEAKRLYLRDCREAHIIPDKKKLAKMDRIMKF